MKYLYIFLFLYTHLLAQNTNLTIQGECQGYPDQKVYISQLSENGEIIDTVDLVSEKFLLEKRILNEEWFQIRFQHRAGWIELFTSPGEKIRIFSKSSEKLDKAIIKGSPESITRNEYIDNIIMLGQQNRAIIDSITFYEGKGVPVPQSLTSKIDSLEARNEEMVFETILKTKSLLLKDLCLMQIKSPIYINTIKTHIDSLSHIYQENHDFKNLQRSYYHYLDHQLNLESLDLEKFLMNFSFQSNNKTPITHQNLFDKHLFIELRFSSCNRKSGIVCG